MTLHRVLFCGFSSVLGITIALLGLRVANGHGVLERITTATVSGRDSLFPSVDFDGTRIAFESNADFYGQGISTREIWLYDATTLTYTRVTTASANDRRSIVPSLDAAGTRIVFRSNSDFLNEGIEAGQSEIWLYDLATNKLTRVTQTSGLHLLDYPVLSGNGQWVAFESNFDFLGQGVKNYEIWLYSTAAMTVTRVTTATTAGRMSRNPSLDFSGTKLVFLSDNDFLGQGVPADQNEIWLYDTLTMSMTRVTNSNGGGRSGHARLGSDGRKVVFASEADFLNRGISLGQYEIWLYDTVALTYTRITQASAANRESFYPSMNVDGTQITFVSDSDFLEQGIADDQYEVWLYDTAAMTYTRVTSGSVSNPDNFMPVLSGNGSKIAFSSDTDFFEPGLPRSQYEIWAYDFNHLRIYLPLLVK